MVVCQAHNLEAASLIPARATKTTVMIYIAPKKSFPKPNQHIECHSYKDENGFEWKMARVLNGFFVAYFGDAYFMPNKFSIKLGKQMNAPYTTAINTGCIFIKDTSFDTYCHLRNILRNGYTDDIWESIEELLQERFIHESLTSD